MRGPLFKSKHSSKQSYRTPHFKIVDDSHIRLPKVGDVKMRLSRPIEGHPTSATVKKVPSGDYYVTIVCKDVPQAPLPKAKTEIVGVDAGVKAIATCSNDMVLENDHVLKRNEKKLRREQRRLSRKQKGSKNRERQRVRLAQTYEKVANARYDRTQKFTTALMRDSQAIAVEDLNIEGMKKNHRLAKAISDACMGELIRELEYKSKMVWKGLRKGRQMVPIVEDLQPLRLLL